jgi:hypothetical protein
LWPRLDNNRAAAAAAAAGGGGGGGAAGVEVSKQCRNRNMSAWNQTRYILDYPLLLLLPRTKAK